MHTGFLAFARIGFADWTNQLVDVFNGKRRIASVDHYHFLVGFTLRIKTVPDPA
jgi:hypothetical protein